MSDDFKDSVIKGFVTPDKMGKAFIVVCGLVFAAGVMVTSSEREHESLREITKNNALQISSNMAQTVALTLELKEVTTGIKKDQEISIERGRIASDDRERLQDTLNTILGRLPR